MSSLKKKFSAEDPYLAIASAILLYAASIVLTPQVSAQTPTNAFLPSGYTMAPLATGLDFPTSVAFGLNTIWVSEAGIISPTAPPQIKEISANGTTRVILSDSMLESGKFAGPITDITFYSGFLWVAHREVGVNGWLVGAISRFDPNDPVGTFTTVLTGLPSAGDHYTEEIVFDSAGRLYFSQGTASNSGVIGPDNELITQWLGMFPTFHDFSPQTVVLSGASYTNRFPFALDTAAQAVTAPYSKFNSGHLVGGTVILGTSPTNPQEGMVVGNGAVYSFDPFDTNIVFRFRLEAWGLRNPYGIGFDPRNPTNLFVSNNGADTRSVAAEGGLRVVESRPLNGDWDDMFVVPVGGPEEFFGWPDFLHHPQTGAVLPITDPLFCTQQPGLNFPCPEFLLAPSFHSTLLLEPAFAQFEEHSSANKFDFATSPNFGFTGDIFVAETGAFVPVTGAAQFAGHKVVRVGRDTRTVHDFIAHSVNSQEVIFDPTGFNKPIDVKFRQERMFVVDLGVYEPGLKLAQPGTGKLWVVTSTARALPGLRTEGGLISGAAVPNEPPVPVTNVTPGEDPRRRTGTIPATKRGPGGSKGNQ